MKRLYYITDKLAFAEHISVQLIENGIDQHHIHVLSQDDAGVVTHHLSGLNVSERMDIIHDAVNGLILGLIVAVASMFIAKFGWGAELSILGQIALVCLLLLLGSWVGGLIGFAQENYQLRQFHKQVKEGRHLMMVDVKSSEEKQVHKIIDYLNEAEFSGEETYVVP